MNPLTQEQVVEKLQAKRASATPAKGHNSEGQLGSYVDRLVNVKEEKQRAAEDERDLKEEAKGNGFDPRALDILAKRKMEDAAQRQKREDLASIVDTYAAAIGMLV